MQVRLRGVFAGVPSGGFGVHVDDVWDDVGMIYGAMLGAM